MKCLLRVVLLCATLSIVIFPSTSALENKEKKEPIILTGIIYDEITNQPYPNLKVFPGPVGKEVAVTDSKGVFKFPVEPGAREAHILPFSNDIVGRSVYVDVKEFEHKIVKIVVEHGMKLKVKVQDTDGKPIKDANVVYMPGGGASGQTDDNGIAVMAMVSRIRDGRLTVRAPKYEVWTRDNMYAPLYTDDGITVTLKPADPETKQANDEQ